MLQDKFFGLTCVNISAFSPCWSLQYLAMHLWNEWVPGHFSYCLYIINTVDHTSHCQNQVKKKSRQTWITVMSLSGYKIIRYSHPRSKIGKKAHWTLLILLTGYICDVQYITNKNLIWIESTNTCPCLQ